MRPVRLDQGLRSSDEAAQCRNSCFSPVEACQTPDPVAVERGIGFLANGPAIPSKQDLKNLAPAIREALNRANTKRFPGSSPKGERDSLRYLDPLPVKIEDLLNQATVTRNTGR
ncbi:MAG: hypothetical protein VST70_07845 [Nitrospirota bacterium]|nr:hypothetical protein [Nitrospirota bacterium]